jgi:hypothetical protein
MILLSAKGTSFVTAHEQDGNCCIKPHIECLKSLMRRLKGYAASESVRIAEKNNVSGCIGPR